MIGRTLGRYRVMDRLGRGGMGEVYLAEDTALKRRVAIKKLADALPDDARWAERLRREAEALAAVNHPNVVTVHALEEVDGVGFVVMEWLQGRTLAELLPDDGFPAELFFELARPVAAALEAVHERGVLHRDLKPGNVMVTADGRVKVVDFGLARIASERAGAESLANTTTHALAAGTLPYMSLEQMVGDQADPRSDLYSLGVLLFEMATGRLPFTGRTVAELMRRIAVGPPPDPTEHRPDLPPRLGRLVRRLLSSEPEARPENARAVAEELRACVSEGAAGGHGAARRTPPAVVPAPGPPGLAPDTELLQLVARGRRLWNRRSEDALRTALACFQEAIDRDPMHAPAWIGVADTLNMLSNHGFAHPGDSHLRVAAAVDRAVALEGESSDALRVRALAAWQFDYDWAGAGGFYRRALELEPDAPLTHYWYGILLGVTRRFEEAFEAFRRAEALDPLSLMAPAARGWFTLFSGRPGEAHEILQRVLAMDARLHPALWFDGQALSALGRHEEAVASFSEAIRIGGRTTRMTGYLGFALGSGGRTEGALAVLDELRSLARERYVPPYFEALILIGLGEREETLERLETAFETRDTMLRDLGVDPPWWGLRGEPRYERLMGEMGLRAEGT